MALKRKKEDVKLAEEKFKKAMAEFSAAESNKQTTIDPREQISKWRVAVLNELKKTEKGFEVLPKKIFSGIKAMPVKHYITKIPEKVIDLHTNTVAAAQTVKNIHKNITTKVKATILPSHFRHWLHIITVVVLGLVIYAGLAMVRLDRQWPALATYLPWPAAYVNGHFIMLSDLDSNTQPIIKLYESKLSRRLYSDEIAKIEDGVLDKLIKNDLISTFIKTKHIAVTDTMLQQVRQDFVQSFSDEQAMRLFVATSYGWTYDQFEKNIMWPYLMQMSFEKYLAELPSVQLAAKQMAGLYKDQITSGAVDFATLAKGKSDDANTNEAGGDLGWIQAGTMEPNLEKVISTLQIGEISDPVRTAGAYHIFKLLDKTSSATDASWHLAHIMVNITNVDTWLKHERQLINLYRLVRIY